jgi:hypothetical protein
VLFPQNTTPSQASWGDRALPEPGPEFSPHGIHLSELNNGNLQVLVVQHGLRESVERFILSRVQSQNTSSWHIKWTGAVLGPEESTLNDVVATPDGGFLVTDMMPKADGMMAQFMNYLQASLFGEESGKVHAWHPQQGFSILESSRGIIPNGIEIAEDGKTVFINFSSGGLRRINWITDEIELDSAEFPALDNASWSPDGRLLVAAVGEDMITSMACTNLEEGTCPGQHHIIAVDPITFEQEIIYTGGAGTPGGTGTIGIMTLEGELLVGTFAGDRIVRVKKEEFLSSLLH